jgi:serine protease Do
VNDDDLIREIASRAPGTAVHLQVVRDGRTESMTVKLAERPGRDTGQPHNAAGPAAPDRHKAEPDDPLGFAVRDLDRQSMDRLDIPRGFHGVLVTRVDPFGPSYDAGIERNSVLLEINRQPVESAAQYRRVARAAHPGDVLALYVYYPDLDQRRLFTVRVDGR